MKLKPRGRRDPLQGPEAEMYKAVEQREPARGVV